MPLLARARPCPAAPPAVALAVTVTLAALCGRPAGAQPGSGDTTQPATAASRTDPFCWRGRPLPRCRSFVLFELGVNGRIAVTRTTIGIPSQSSTQEFTEESIGPQLSWSVGLMRNRDSLTAVGGAIVAGATSRGGMIGAQARYRRWLGPAISAELAAGPLAVHMAEPRQIPGFTFPIFDERLRLGAAADARLNVADRVAGSVRLIAVPSRGRVHGGAFVGGHVGSGLAVAGTVGLAAFVVFLYYALSTAYT